MSVTAETKREATIPDRGKPIAAAMWCVSNHNRMRMLYALHKSGPVSVSAMAEILDVSMAFVSQSMAMLQRAGMVNRERDRQTVYYSLNTESPFVQRVLMSAFALMEESNNIQ